MKKNRKSRLYERTLRLESLESRQMLSAAPSDVETLKECAAAFAESDFSDATIDLSASSSESEVLKFAATNASGSYAMTWDPIDDAVSYRIQISRDGGSTWINSRTSESASYEARDLRVGITTMFRVYGVDSYGKRMDDPLEGTFSRIALTTLEKSYSVGDTLSVALDGAEDSTASVKWYRVADDGDVEITAAANSLSYETTRDDFGYDLKVVATGSGISEGSDSEILIAANYDLAFSYDFQTKRSTVSWNEMEGASSYRIQLQKAVGDSTIWVNCATTTTPSYTAKQVYPDVEYVFRSLAYDSSGSLVGVYSGTLTPTKPVLRLETSYSVYDTVNRSVELTWNVLEDSDYYNVQTLGTSGQWLKCAVVSVDAEGNVSGKRTTCEDGRFAYKILMHDAGVAATYRVVAKSSSGVELATEESTYASLGLELDRDAYDISGDVLTATTSPETSATYQWYYSSDSGVSWTAIDAATDASYEIASDAAAKLYWYKLVATDGARSSVVYAEPQTFGASKPLDLVRDLDADGNLALTFKAVDGVATDSYQIEYYLADKDYPVWINLTSVSLTANADGTITATRPKGANYSQYADDQFRVRAVSESGWSEWNGVERKEPSGLVVTTSSDVVDPNDGLVSLREAIAYAESLGGNQTVTFAPEISSVQISETIKISDSVALDGSGVDRAYVTIDAQSQCGAFLVSGENATLDVKNLEFLNGAAYRGSAIYVEGNADVNVEACRFIHNNEEGAADHDAGVIYGENGSSISVVNSLFDENDDVAVNAYGDFSMINCSVVDSTHGIHYGGDSVGYVSNSIFWDLVECSLLVHHGSTLKVSTTLAPYGTIGACRDLWGYYDGYYGTLEVVDNSLWIAFEGHERPVGEDGRIIGTGEIRLTDGETIYLVDSGSNADVVGEADADGNPRVVDYTGTGEPNVDLGAFEVQALSDAFADLFDEAFFED